MKKEKIIESIKSSELKLEIWEIIHHFYIVGFILILPVSLLGFHLFDIYNGKTSQLKEGEIWFYIIPPILSILFYYYQKNRLKFKIVNTNLNRNEIASIIEKVGTELKWIPYIVNEKVIIAKTNPSFLSGSWGEKITILFDSNKVYINSICDPDKRISISSMGRNKENMNKLAEEIKKASC